MMKQYLEASRSPWYSLLFVLPLWLLYEVLVVAANLGRGGMVVNGADAFLRDTLGVLGMQGRLAGMVALAVVAAVWVCRADSGHRKKGIYPGYFLYMLAESALYALMFGGVVVWLMQLLLPGFIFRLQVAGVSSLDLGLRFTTSLGAGVYEELVFRVLLMGGACWAGVHFLKLKPGASLLIAMIVSSLAFSAFHYIGSMRDTLTAASFLFRFFAGILLAVLYRLRGFGIAAYTHALYDVFLVLQGRA